MKWRSKHWESVCVHSRSVAGDAQGCFHDGLDVHSDETVDGPDGIHGAVRVSCVCPEGRKTLESFCLRLVTDLKV